MDDKIKKLKRESRVIKIPLQKIKPSKKLYNRKKKDDK
jgi:hypothetical protein